MSASAAGEGAPAGGASAPEVPPPDGAPQPPAEAAAALHALLAAWGFQDTSPEAAAITAAVEQAARPQQPAAAPGLRGAPAPVDSLARGLVRAAEVQAGGLERAAGVLADGLERAAGVLADGLAGGIERAATALADGHERAARELARALRRQPGELQGHSGFPRHARTGAADAALARQFAGMPNRSAHAQFPGAIGSCAIGATSALLTTIPEVRAAAAARVLPDVELDVLTADFVAMWHALGIPELGGLDTSSSTAAVTALVSPLQAGMPAARQGLAAFAVAATALRASVFEAWGALVNAAPAMPAASVQTLLDVTSRVAAINTALGRVQALLVDAAAQPGLWPALRAACSAQTLVQQSQRELLGVVATMPAALVQLPAVGLVGAATGSAQAATLAAAACVTPLSALARPLAGHMAARRPRLLARLFLALVHAQISPVDVVSREQRVALVRTAILGVAESPCDADASSLLEAVLDALADSVPSLAALRHRFRYTIPCPAVPPCADGGRVSSCPSCRLHVREHPTFRAECWGHTTLRAISDRAPGAQAASPLLGVAGAVARWVERQDVGDLFRAHVAGQVVAPLAVACACGAAYPAVSTGTFVLREPAAEGQRLLEPPAAASDRAPSSLVVVTHSFRAASAGGFQLLPSEELLVMRSGATPAAPLVPTHCKLVGAMCQRAGQHFWSYGLVSRSGDGQQLDPTTARSWIQFNDETVSAATFTEVCRAASMPGALVSAVYVPIRHQGQAPPAAAAGAAAAAARGGGRGGGGSSGSGGGGGGGGDPGGDRQPWPGPAARGTAPASPAGGSGASATGTARTGAASPASGEGRVTSPAGGPQRGRIVVSSAASVLVPHIPTTAQPPSAAPPSDLFVRGAPPRAVSEPVPRWRGGNLWN